MKTYSHDFEVADMGLLEWGRNEIRIAVMSTKTRPL
jgi:hypothetical protein